MNYFLRNEKQKELKHDCNYFIKVTVDADFFLKDHRANVNAC